MNNSVNTLLQPNSILQKLPSAIDDANVFYCIFYVFYYTLRNMFLNVFLFVNQCFYHLWCNVFKVIHRNWYTVTMED